jgi:hypothetical protein
VSDYPPRGPAAIAFRGRTIAREQGFVHLGEIACPDLHKMGEGGFTVLGGGLALTCMNKSSQGSAACGALLWLVQCPAPMRLGSLFYVADVEYRELKQWEESCYSLEAIFRYLGAWFTRGDERRDRAFRRRVA